MDNFSDLPAGGQHRSDHAQPPTLPPTQDADGQSTVSGPGTTTAAQAPSVPPFVLVSDILPRCDVPAIGDRPSQPLVLLLSGRRTELSADSLQDDAVVGQLQEACGAAEQPPVFVLQHLVTWPREVRWAVLRFLTSLGPSVRFRANDDTADSADLFGAVLSLLTTAEDVTRCTMGVEAAVEAAALIHSDRLPAACSRIVSRLKELKVSGYTSTKLRRMAQQMVPTASDNGETCEWEVTAIHTVLPDAPVPAGVVIPPKWLINTVGVRHVGSDDDQDALVCLAPIVITRRLRDAGSGAESLGVAWLRDEVWHEEIVP